MRPLVIQEIPEGAAAFMPLHWGGLIRAAFRP